MVPDEQVASIRHLFHAEHWKIGTIATELLLHPDTVRRALETDHFRSQPPCALSLPILTSTSCARLCSNIRACAPPVSFRSSPARLHG